MMYEGSTPSRFRDLLSEDFLCVELVTVGLAHDLRDSLPRLFRRAVGILALELSLTLAPLAFIAKNSRSARLNGAASRRLTSEPERASPADIANVDLNQLRRLSWVSIRHGIEN